MARHLDAGRSAERLARAFLEHQGLAWVASNFQCRGGELDLIMTEADTLVIVEVRYRRHTAFLHPAHSVNTQKIRRIVHATEWFTQTERRWRERPVRFDIVGVHGPLDSADMNWIRDAFTIDDLQTS